MKIIKLIENLGERNHCDFGLGIDFLDKTQKNMNLKRTN